MAVCIVPVAVALAAQSPPEPPEPPARFGAAATAVIVDIVVRDRDGKPVTDLTDDDFELFEDGVRQKVEAFTVVGARPGGSARRRASRAPADVTASGSQAQPSSDGPRGAGSPLERPWPGTAGPTVVAFAFDRLSPEARALAHRAALSYLDGEPREDDYAGVFLIDLSLHTVQTYTNDRARLRRAIDEVASRATSTYDRDGNRINTGLKSDHHPSVPVTAGAESAGRGDLDAGHLPGRTPDRRAGEADLNAVEVMLARMAERMERSYEAMVRDQQGYATTAGLTALVSSLGALPGRKTVVFFAEGLTIPPAVEARFQTVIAAANRHNVSIYSIDAAGLRVHSRQAEVGREVAALGRRGTGDELRDDNEAFLRDLERNEDALRMDPSASLRVLASRTGGFLIDNTNDLPSGFRRIDADRRFHYLLTYQPTNSALDGTYRRITVKVKRSKVEVRARGGYLALPSSLASLPVLAHEAPAIAALSQQPRPDAIPLRAAALPFPRPDMAEVPTAVLVAVPGSALTWEVDASTRTHRAELAILARFVDAAGEVVRKASQPYRLSGSIEDLERSQRGEILFYRQPSLPPGRYTFEFAAYDALGRKAAAGTQAIDVPAPRAGEPLVSVMLVERAELVPDAERDPENPLYLGPLLHYPRLGRPFSRNAGQPLSLFCTIHSDGPVSASVEIAQGGRTLATLPVDLPPPDGAGRIQHVLELPAATLQPGSYEVALHVAAGASSVTRRAAFTVSE